MSAWAEYGFPDPRLLPSRLPMEGLLKAVAERWLPFKESALIKDFLVKGTDTTIGDILQHDITGTLRQIDASYSYAQNALPCLLDKYIRNVCGKYLNHRDSSKTAWTWQSLCDCAAPDGLVEPERLAPVLHAEYADQRYRMINLLRFPMLGTSGVTADVCFGSTHNGLYHDMQSSLNFAISENSKTSDKSVLIVENYIEGIYGPDHGWNEGTYCCNIYETANASLDDSLDNSVSSDMLKRLGIDKDELICVMDVTAAGGDDANFNDMGFGVSLGRNNLRQQDGVFLKRSLPYIPATPPTPVAGKSTYLGWHGRLLIFCDFATHFLFYDNVEEG